MPELPEVENARRILVKAELPGRSITGATVSWPATVKEPGLEDFLQGICGHQIGSIGRRGKYILLPLDGGLTFIIHLGMTGGVTVQSAGREPDAMVRHRFTLDDGRVLWFRDPRKFGHLWLTPDLDKTLPSLGPEPLSEEFSTEYLVAAFENRSAPIKATLLEQSVAAGLGNLYVDESLYRAGIHPARPAGSLARREVAALRSAIEASLQSAIAIYDRDREAEWPDPPSALSTWTIPRREGDPCPGCGSSIISTRIRARGTYFCPECQPIDPS